MRTMKLLLPGLLIAAALLAQEPPRSGSSARMEGKSSSKDTQIDISAPGDDAKKHPDSEDVTSTSEFRPFNPHKAAKNVEVGDYYFSQKNFKAAISRYQEALEWKPNDAIATYRLAVAFEKDGDAKDAAQNYQAYLKILPEGPYAKDSRKALERLTAGAKP